MWICCHSLANEAAEKPPQRIESQTQASASQVDIAAPFEVIITATFPASLQIQPPAPKDYLGDLRVLESTDTMAKTGEMTSWKRALLCEGYQPGPQMVPPQELIFQGKENGKAEASPVSHLTPPARIQVRSALPFFEFRPQLRPISGKVWAPWGLREWLFALAVVAGFVAAGYFGRRLIRYWRPAVISHARELGKMKDDWLIGSMTDREAVLGCADLLRRRLHFLEGPRAAYRTTRQWRNWLAEQTEFPNESRLKAEALFEKADRVKFAGDDVTLDDVRECFHLVESLLARHEEMAKAKPHQQISAGGAS